MKKKHFPTLLMAFVFALMALTPALALASEEPTPSPIASPTASPSASPTEASVLNLKLYLMDANGYALPGYIVTLDNNTQSIADQEGIAGFDALDPTKTDTYKVFTPDKKQVGACNISYEQRAATGIGTNTQDNSYQIDYDMPNSTFYVSLVVDPNGGSNTPCYPSAASDTPLTPGKEQPVTDPSVYGYLVDQNNQAVADATVESTNENTGESVSGVTAADGAYSLSGMAVGTHVLSVYQNDGTAMGTLTLVVQAGTQTGIVKLGNQDELTLKAGLGKLYMNLQTDGRGALTVLGVSEAQMASPAIAAPVVTPSASPGQGDATVPTSTAPTSSTMIIIVVAIIAAAAIIIAVIVTHNKKKKNA